MRERPVPVTMGSPRFRTLDTGGCVATEAWFPPGAVLAPHTHSRSIFATMLRGGFRTTIAARSLDCSPMVVWTEPREERHANYVGRLGAHVMVIEADHQCEDLFAPFASIIDEVRLLSHPLIAADARRVCEELRIGDALSSIAIEALVTGMMIAAGRSNGAKGGAGRTPRWLLRARDVLHERFRGPIRLREVAALVDVHPSHLAHSFRAHFGMTVGDYLRRLRVDWAADQLLRSELPISEIAASAGYSDQSHFTRECRRYLGCAPGEYRLRRSE